ncbi:MAG: hypothetical protein HYT48_00910 [Candidatus Vogelbacteria bacterium]|nr:hypothetical protein [Candidatus Vogelbacteria bacterium]
MAEIIPAILGDNFKTVERHLAQVDALVAWAHLDVSDGLFAPYLSWQQPENLNEITSKIKIEAHLMIEQPEEYLPEWINVADRIIVHYEATEKLEHILATFEPLAVKFGLALLLPTPLEVVESYINKVDVIQLMGIAEIGQQGYPFEERVFGRVKTLRAKYPDVTISIDGGVSLQNAKQLIAAGANRLVVGSAIWQSKNVEKTIKKFQQLAA